MLTEVFSNRYIQILKDYQTRESSLAWSKKYLTEYECLQLREILGCTFCKELEPEEIFKNSRLIVLQYEKNLRVGFSPEFTVTEQLLIEKMFALDPYFDIDKELE